MTDTGHLLGFDIKPDGSAVIEVRGLDGRAHLVTIRYTELQGLAKTSRHYRAHSKRFEASDRPEGLIESTPDSDEVFDQRVAASLERLRKADRRL